MLAPPEPACLVIADISGYTGYLAGTELDHAQDVLADLMDTVVSSLRPRFRLAKLEGDAAFVFAPAERIDGSLLQDTVEGCYFAFRRRLRDIRQASSCECNACILIPNLNLKLVAHHGSIARQRIAGREELVGSDVIVVHRLLKNSVEDALGFAAYALYTDACVRMMDVDPVTLGLHEHRETYEHVGEVVGWVRDLEAAWAEEQERRRLVVPRESALWVLELDYPAPPEVLWEYLTLPGRRVEWQAGVTDVREDAGGGRRGVGTTNHCVHGRDAIVEEILDWRPGEYQTMRFQIPSPGIPKIVLSHVLVRSSEGTRVELRVQRPRSAKDRAIVEQLGPMLEESVRAGHARLVPLLVEEMRRRREVAEAAEEPPLPATLGRHLAERVAGLRSAAEATDPEPPRGEPAGVDSAMGRSS
jgi:uncharacterized protein YndB with AHSA1/START domain